jgi:hypothetical protein
VNVRRSEPTTSGSTRARLFTVHALRDSGFVVVGRDRHESANAISVPTCDVGTVRVRCPTVPNVPRTDTTRRPAPHRQGIVQLRVVGCQLEFNSNSGFVTCRLIVKPL